MIRTSHKPKACTMITKVNFKDLLQTLGFTAEGNTFQKSIGEADLKVDFSKQRLIYPEDRGLIVNRQDISNFSQNENFVVFECVHRLLEQGYKPEHLELEPTWRIGHSASGGRADILVKDQQNNPLLIIECKTAGDEFEKAWDTTRQDGGQLFSYVHQDAETQYLCLYASDFSENELISEYKLIPHLDNPQILAEDTTLLSFEKANKAEHRFAVWRDTYKLAHTEVGIFEDNIQAYQIGKNNYTLAEDTKPIGAIDKDRKYHQFRTILRKHNIARRENAFEVLVNLFLCKLVDEEENKTALKFYWNGPASDNYFDFVDRLQNLYQKGMGKFLNEEISYISGDQIDSAFWPVKNDRNAVKKQIQAYFRELKFFSNSAFSFLDTHNEDLFDRNTAVLSEVVQLWQGLRLKTDAQNQFLGDMFEFFLDNGIKQSEGQFFTPLPICKFIVASLPLARKIEANPEPLKAVDYACGSGHFLNEYAHQIKPLVEAHNRAVTDYYSQITGVEKEDRLAKVAKVAAYMHGQEDIEILDADALATHPKIQRESFDLLVANPPFAVEGFLETVSDTDKEQYQLIQAIDKSKIHNNNDIECFFLERIHHLMVPEGVVGVIVPSGILSNKDTVRIHTRELLLQFFDLVGIAELGGETFSKTGTNTVVLFLRRKAQRPEPAEHYRDRVDDFFEGDDEGMEYQDEYLIKAYCNHIKVPYEEYIKLFAQTSVEPLTKLLQYDIFKEYKKAFDKSTELKDLKKSKGFKEKTETEQSAELEQRLIAYLHKIEKDKLYYFILAHEQASKVLIVRAPSNSEEQQNEFLGYKWGTRKGSEGIEYNKAETVNDIITPLFDPKDLDNSEKINTAIKRNFIGETTDPLPAYCHYAVLTDMLDFTRIDFNKVINLNPKQNTDIETQWELVKLGEVVEVRNGGTPNTKNPDYWNGGDICWATLVDTKNKYLYDTERKITQEGLNNSSAVLLPINTVIFSSRATIGDVSIAKVPTATNQGYKNFICNPDVLHYEYLYYVLKFYAKEIATLAVGMTYKEISSTNIKNYQIPLPPLEVQQQIVNECEAVDQETDQARQTITAARQKIEELVSSVEKTSTLNQVVDKISDIVNPKEKTGLVYYVGLENIESQTGVLTGDPQSDFSEIDSNKNVFRRGDILYGKLRPNLNKVHLANIDGICSTDILVLRPYNPNLATFYKHYFLSEEFNSEVIKTVTGQQLPRTSWDKISRMPVPLIDIPKQLVAEVERLDAKVPQAQAVIDNAAERKNAILTKYL